MTKTKKSIIDIGIYILVILMPFQTQIFEYIIPGNVDNLWRDFLLIIILLSIVLKNKGILNIGRYGALIFLTWVICLIYTLTSSRPQMAIYLDRVYILPTFIYFIVINHKSDYLKISKYMVYVACIISVWGIYQAFVLGDAFLISLGYPSMAGHLSSDSFYISGFWGIQRVVGTFSSPNLCGVYFGIALLVAMKLGDYLRGKKIICFLLIAGLLTTFSRSAIVGTLIAFLLTCIDYKEILKLLKYIIFIFPIVGLILFIIDNYLFSGQIYNMLISSFSGIFNNSDPSAREHGQDLKDTLSVIFQFPFGLGYGKSGPIVASYYNDANLVESSIYLEMYNFGLIGGIIVLLPYMKKITDIFFRKDIGVAISILVFFTYALLPNIECFEITFFVYFFMAVGEYLGDDSFEKNGLYDEY